MSITVEDIESITVSVWENMLQRSLTADPGKGMEALAPSHVGLIHLAGAFEGLVTLHLPETIVRGAASVMFGVHASDVTDEQMRDTVAELTNMVGGNVKCLVAQPTQLALPEVYAPEAVTSVLGDARCDTAVVLCDDDGSLGVAIHERVRAS